MCHYTQCPDSCPISPPRHTKRPEEHRRPPAPAWIIRPREAGLSPLASPSDVTKVMVQVLTNGTVGMCLSLS
jgi:hypothetical protein